MNLIDGFIVNTLNIANNQSKHATLMQFYQLDIEIGQMEDNLLEGFISSNMTSREYQSKRLPILFLKAKALTLLQSL